MGAPRASSPRLGGANLPLQAHQKRRDFVARYSCLAAYSGLACRRTRASARDTLTLALSHQGRGDSLAALGTWFRMAVLFAGFWIPAFAGMTGGDGGGRRDLSLVILDWFRMARLFAGFWIPAFVGMTGGDGGGRRDLSLVILDWFRMAVLFDALWIPAFAGMMGENPCE